MTIVIISVYGGFNNNNNNNNNVYLSRAKDIKDAFKVCPTPDPCLVVEGKRHMRFPGVPRTKSSILLTIKIHQIRWRVTGLPTTLDAFNAIPRRLLHDSTPPTSPSSARRDSYIIPFLARYLLISYFHTYLNNSYQIYKEEHPCLLVVLRGACSYCSC
jgi:hypothetical protein